MTTYTRPAHLCLTSALFLNPNINHCQLSCSSAALNKLNLSHSLGTKPNQVCKLVVNLFVNCWAGNHSNYCITKGWDSCRSLGQTDFSLALSKHPGIPFFSRSTHKKFVWSSQGCIFEAPERICIHTRMWFMPELLIQSRNGNAATACGSFTQMLPNTTKEI